VNVKWTHDFAVRKGVSALSCFLAIVFHFAQGNCTPFSPFASRFHSSKTATDPNPFYFEVMPFQPQWPFPWYAFAFLALSCVCLLCLNRLRGERYADEIKCHEKQRC